MPRSGSAGLVAVPLVVVGTAVFDEGVTGLIASAASIASPPPHGATRAVMLSWLAIGVVAH